MNANGPFDLFILALEAHVLAELWRRLKPARELCHRRLGTGEVHIQGGPPGGVPARVAPAHRSVLVRAAVCHQVAQRVTHRLNGRMVGRLPQLCSDPRLAQKKGEPGAPGILPIGAT